MDIKRLLLISISIMMLVLLSACSNSSNSDTDSSDNGESTTSTGVITSMSASESITLNGVQYDTSNSNVMLEDAESLAVGMVATVEGPVDDQDSTGTADTIMHESEVKGIVLENNVAVDNTLNVMGQLVMVDEMTVYVSEDPAYATVDSIPQYAVVEVSGFVHMDGSIKATRIELERVAYQPNMMLKVNGQITEVADGYFKMNQLMVMYDENTKFLHVTAQELAVGQYVKVKSKQPFDFDMTSLLADSIKLKKHGIEAEQGERIKIYGEVTSDGVTDGMFTLNDQAVMITDKTAYENGTVDDIQLGVRLKVKGRLDESDVLVAEEIVFEKAQNVNILGFVDEVDTEGNYIVVMGAMVSLHNTTLMEDHSHNNMSGENKAFVRTDIAQGDFVKVNGYYQENGVAAVKAFKVGRYNPEDNREVVVVGPVNAVDLESNMLEVVGIKVDISAFPDLMVNVGDKAELTGSYDEVTGIVTPNAIKAEAKYQEE